MTLKELLAGTQPGPAFSLAKSVSSDVVSKETVLKTEEEIGALFQKSRNLLLPLHITKITISIDDLPAASKEFEVRLSDCLRECGCDSGSVAGAAGLFAYLALLPVVVGWPSAWRWRHLFIGVIFCFGAAMLGKLFGLLRARVRLVRELESLWEICRKRQTMS